MDEATDLIKLKLEGMFNKSHFFLSFTALCHGLVGLKLANTSNNLLGNVTITKGDNAWELG